jgi:hypothetical protein
LRDPLMFQRFLGGRRREGSPFPSLLKLSVEEMLSVSRATPVRPPSRLRAPARFPCKSMTTEFTNPTGSWVGNTLLLQPVRFDRATELMHPHADKTGKPA